MNKVAYIIPGYDGTQHLNNVQLVATLFKSMKVTPVPIKIRWKYRTMSDYLSDLFSQVRANENREMYLFGFSYGAMIALLSAPVLQPTRLYLCSLSPYFKEDLILMREQVAIKIIGKKRHAEFKTIEFNALAKTIKCSTTLLAGEKESESVIGITQRAHERIKKARMIIVPHASHNLNHVSYRNTLKEILSN